MSDSDFSIPRRQEGLGVIILFGENLRKLLRIVAALVFASIYADEIPFSAPAIIGIGVVVMGTYTVFQFLRFKFHIAGGDLIIDKGVLKRERLSIPLERIQTVHLSQNIIQQIVQLTGVKIDTAGSGGQELKISALTRSDALALQRALEKERSSSESIMDGADSIEGSERSEGRKTLVELTLAKLLVVGLTENHIRSGLVALGVVWGYFWQFEDMIKEYLGVQLEMDASQIEEAVSMTSFGLTAIGIGVLVFLVASMFISLVRIVMKHYGLKATYSSHSLRVSSGLLKKNSYTIPLTKIQMITWNGNFLRSIPGFESVMISQSSSSKENEKTKVEIPACYSEQTKELEDALFSEKSQTRFFSYSPHPFYRVYLGLLFSIPSIVPFGFMFAAGYKLVSPILFLGYVIMVVLWVRRYVQSVTLATNGSLIQYSRGWLFTNRTLLKTYKIQSVRFRQSILQKRRGTAHLSMYTAGGSLTIRFMPELLVQELYNYLLYSVETSKENWM